MECRGKGDDNSFSYDVITIYHCLSYSISHTLLMKGNAHNRIGPPGLAAHGCYVMVVAMEHTQSTSCTALNPHPQCVTERCRWFIKGHINIESKLD